MERGWNDIEVVDPATVPQDVHHPHGVQWDVERIAQQELGLVVAALAEQWPQRCHGTVAADRRVDVEALRGCKLACCHQPTRPTACWIVEDGAVREGCREERAAAWAPATVVVQIAEESLLGVVLRP